MAQETQSAAAAVETDDGTNGKRSGKTFLIVVLAVVLAALGSGAVAAYFLSPQVAALFGGPAVAEESTPAEDEVIEYGEFMELQGIIINPAESGGSRFLMVNVALEGKDAAALEAVSSKEYVVRDRILRLLSKRTTAELADIALRDSIKLELLDSVNELLQETEVNRLYFTQYVLQ